MWSYRATNEAQAKYRIAVEREGALFTAARMASSRAGKMKHAGMDAGEDGYCLGRNDGVECAKCALLRLARDLSKKAKEVLGR